jgi:hypothetical protein
MGKRVSAARGTVLCVAVLMAILPGAASAADPLLSGYGGPGRGEQAVLGDHYLPAPKGGSGSLHARPAATPAATGTRVAAPARPVPAGSGAGDAKPGADSSASSGSRGGGTPPKEKQKEKARRGARSAGRATALELQPVAYPSSARGAGGIPLSRADTVLVVLGLVVLTFLALALRRLASGEARPPAA